MITKLSENISSDPEENLNVCNIGLDNQGQARSRWFRWSHMLKVDAEHERRIPPLSLISTFLHNNQTSVTTLPIIIS